MQLNLHTYFTKVQKKLIVFIQDLLQVTKLTKTKNKKIRILSIAVVSNVVVLIGNIIILSFTNIFTKEVGIENSLINFFSKTSIYCH